MPDGKQVCFACCGVRDRADMIATGRAMLYLSRTTVSNWPGTLTFQTGRIVKGRHNIARTRYDAWFCGPDGFVWHGVQYGDNTQIIHCKRTREAC